MIFSRVFVIIVYSLIISPLVGQSSMIGIWEGDLGKDGKALIVNFEILADDNKYVSKMSCAAQSMHNLITSKTVIEEDSVEITVNRLAGRLTGTYFAQGDTISAVWHQENISAPLLLYRVEEKYRLLRPQLPTPPFPYDTMSVTILNEKANIKLDGLLTIPKGDGPFPAVVLVSGSGPQNKDEEIMEHKPFLVLSDHLARNGIASLRYDDRGVGKSGGDFHSATSFDFADDAEAAFKTLIKSPEIDLDRMGIIGHSEGAMIAPVVACRNKEVDYIILLAGPAVDISELMVTQNKMVFKSLGMDSVAVSENENFNRKIYNIVNADVAQEMLYDTLRKSCISYYQSIDERYRAFLGPTKEIYYFSLSSQLLKPWTRTFLKFRPSDYLSQINIPLLALYGEKDIQVDATQNAEALRETLSREARSKSEILIFPGLNHLFQPAETGNIQEYIEIETTMSTEVMEKVSTWIKENTDNE